MANKKKTSEEKLDQVRGLLINIVVIGGCIGTILVFISTYFIYPELNKRYLLKTEMADHVKNKH